MIENLAHNKVTLIAKTTPSLPSLEGQDTSALIAYIARVSSPKTEEEKLGNVDKLLAYLARNKHWSPFEHVYYTFGFCTDMATAKQVLRHRSFTFQEFSRRYSTHNVNSPLPDWRGQGRNNRQDDQSGDCFSETVRDQFDARASHVFSQAVKLYQYLLDSGVAKSVARLVLPQATSTAIYMTGSLRSWIHFIQIRDDVHAQQEIRSIAQSVKSKLAQECEVLTKTLDLK